MQTTRFYAVYQQLYDKDNNFYDEAPVVIFDYQVDVAEYFGITAQAVHHAISRDERIYWNDARYKVYSYSIKDEDICQDIRLCR